MITAESLREVQRLIYPLVELVQSSYTGKTRWVLTDFRELETRLLGSNKPSRWYRRRQQLLRNLRRPGLKHRRFKHWQNQLQRQRLPWRVYEDLGVTTYNPDAINRVTIKE